MLLQGRALVLASLTFPWACPRRLLCFVVFCTHARGAVVHSPPSLVGDSDQKALSALALSRQGLDPLAARSRLPPYVDRWLDDASVGMICPNDTGQQLIAEHPNHQLCFSHRATTSPSTQSSQASSQHPRICAHAGTHDGASASPLRGLAALLSLQRRERHQGRTVYSMKPLLRVGFTAALDLQTWMLDPLQAGTAIPHLVPARDVGHMPIYRTGGRMACYTPADASRALLSCSPGANSEVYRSDRRPGSGRLQ